MARQETFTALLERKTSEASKYFPYNHDYAKLNQLKFYLDQEDAIDASVSDDTEEINKTYFNNLMYFAEIITQHQLEKTKNETETQTVKNIFFDFYLEHKCLQLQEEKRFIENRLTIAQDKLPTEYDQFSNEKTQKDIENYREQLRKINLTLEAIKTAVEKNKKSYDDLGADLLAAEKTISDLDISEKAPLEIENTFAALSDILSDFDEKFKKVRADKKPTAWQSFMLEQYQQTHPDITTQTPKNFITFLLVNANYLPDQYQDPHAADKNFPSSNTNVCGRGHLDIDGNKKLLAIGAPLQCAVLDMAEKSERDDKTLSLFLKTLQAEKIKCIIALGKNNARIDYAKQYKILITAISVSDNQPLEFDDDTVTELSRAFLLYESGEPHAVHCDSGVGRTGQVRLLFALLNEHKRNSEFKNACDIVCALSSCSELTRLQKNILEKNMDLIFKVMHKTLCKLRKTRYCIQTEAQFAKTLPLLLLVSMQHQYGLEETIGVRNNFVEQRATTARAGNLHKTLSAISATSETTESSEHDDTTSAPLVCGAQISRLRALRRNPTSASAVATTGNGVGDDSDSTTTPFQIVLEGNNRLFGTGPVRQNRKGTPRPSEKSADDLLLDSRSNSDDPRSPTPT